MGPYGYRSYKGTLYHDLYMNVDVMKGPFHPQIEVDYDEETRAIVTRAREYGPTPNELSDDANGRQHERYFGRRSHGPSHLALAICTSLSVNRVESTRKVRVSFFSFLPVL